MKLNTFLPNIINAMKQHALFSYAGLILMWTLIAIVLFTPAARYVVERILEQTSAVAKEDTQYVLTPVDQRTLRDAVNADELQSKVFQNNTVEIGSKSSVTDGRIIAMRRFLLAQNSPMTPHSALIVTEADKYNLDWRLIVSISGVESRFCKIIPAGTFNCWGWKGGPGGAWQEFGSWENGIKHLTARMALGYGRPTSPYDFEYTYCYSCMLTGDHHWADGVAGFMRALQEELEKNNVN